MPWRPHDAKRLAREAREARELAAPPPPPRRAGMPWEQALVSTRCVALSVESDKREREQWTAALDATLSAWRSAYERKPTGCAL